MVVEEIPHPLSLPSLKKKGGKYKGGKYKEKEKIKMKTKKGFTLIELLVVVLIIGILAAIAVPQYKKSVWKTKASQLHIMVESLAKAQQSYYLTNSSYSKDFTSLDIGFNTLPLHPEKSALNFIVQSTDAVRGNDDMELTINATNQSNFSIGVFKKGPYKETGFAFSHIKFGEVSENKLYCVEQNNTPIGNFCVEIFGLPNIYTNQGLSFRFYPL